MESQDGGKYDEIWKMKGGMSHENAGSKGNGKNVGS